MGYATVQQVRDALTKDGGSTTTNTAADMADAQIQKHIERASAEIDSYIQGPYDDAQGDVIPPIVAFWTADLAAYYASLAYRQGKDLTELDPVYLRYQSVIARLASIAAGELDIPVPAAAGDQAFVANQYDGSLFQIWDFDLWGRGGSADVIYKWRGWYWPASYWPGYLM